MANYNAANIQGFLVANQKFSISLYPCKAKAISIR